MNKEIKRKKKRKTETNKQHTQQKRNRQTSFELGQGGG